MRVRDPGMGSQVHGMDARTPIEPAEPIPLISVVIPTRNRCRLLSRTLQALAEQTLRTEEFEILVVSDGSSDQTDTVVAAFQQRPGNIRLQRRTCTGQWIYCWINS